MEKLLESLSPGELFLIGIGIILAIAGLINTVGAAAERISKARKAAAAPTDDLRDRVEVLEKWRTEVDQKLGRDYAELRSIHEGNQAIYQALLALLDHGIDGNNIKQMENAKSGLLSHLTQK